MKSITGFRSLIFLLLVGLCACSRQERLPSVAKNTKENIAKAYELQQKAYVFKSQGVLDSALINYFKAGKLYERAQDSTRAVYTLLEMASILKTFNDYAEMQALDIEALKLLNDPNDTIYNPTIYNDLGISYTGLGDYEKAVAAYEKGTSFTKDAVNKMRIANNIANVWMEKKDYTKAAQLLGDAIQSKHFTVNTEVQALLQDNYAFSLFKLGKPGQEIPMLEAFRIRESSGNYFAAITSALHLADVYRTTNPSKALHFAQSADRFAAATGSADDRLLALGFLMTNSGESLSKGYALDYLHIEDSLKNARQRARNQLAAMKYDYKTERESRLRKELELSEQKNRTLLWILTSTLLASLAVFAVVYFVRRSRRLTREATYRTEIRIAKALHDGLANNVHQAILFTETSDLASVESKETLLQKLDAIYDGTRDLSNDNNEVPSAANFSSGLRDLLSQYNSGNRQVIASGIDGVPWERSEEYKRIECFRIVQELLVNMRKHSECSRAFFAFQYEQKQLRLTYSDDGRGIDNQTVKRKNGPLIMENRILALKGTLSFGENSGKGFRMQIKFPF